MTTRTIAGRAAALAAALWGAAAWGATVEIVSGGATLLPDATEGTAYSVQLTAPESGGEGAVWSVFTTGYSAWMNARVDGFAASGEAMGWQGDETHWRMELPFAFPFFGEEYTVAWVGDNGTIEFGGEYGTLGYDVDEDSLKATVAVAPMWADLDTRDGDIWVATGPQWVEVAWRGRYYSDGEEANVSARLYSDGRIGVMFGEGNAHGGLVGVSGGPGFEDAAQIVRMEGGETKDTVFAPFRMPEGLEFDAETHVLSTGSGVIGDAGTYAFGLSIDTGDEETVDSLVALTVNENPAVRPVFSEWSPLSETVNLAEGGEAGVAFSVLAETADQRAVQYRWFLDGEATGDTGRTCTVKATDAAAHTLAVEASASGMKTSRREWSLGVLRFTKQPEPATVSMGRRAVLECGVEATGGAKVTWYLDTEPEQDEVGTGTRLVLENVRETAKYFAVAESPYGTVESARVTVTATAEPALGRIYKLTGPAFIGNRLVLRAKGYGGDMEAAEYKWYRDGQLAGLGERLDIPALSAGDFGTYTVRLLTHEGGAESEPFVLAPAEAGAPLGWGADDHGRTTAPEGLTGVAQIASGMNFNVALTTNGTVAAWGYNGHGACDVPEGLSGVSSVAAGGYGSCGAGFAVKTDGSVVGWGRAYEDYRYWDDYAHSEWNEETGEWDYTGDWVEYRDGCDVVGWMPEDLGNVVKVAVGGEFAVALLADGSVVTWSRYGEMDEDYYEVPDEVRDAVDIAAGAHFALALLADGRVVAWGDESNGHGCLDVPANLGEAVAVAATKANWRGAAGLALVADGSVAKWGDQAGNIGDGSPEGRIGFGPDEARDVVAIDAGQEHLLALSADGEPRVWCNHNAYGLRWPPREADGAVGIAAGGYHCTAILRDSDGDSIPDSVEPLYGRDPQTWEDWHRTSLSGTVTVDGGAMKPEDGTVSVFDKYGNCLASAEVDEETGRYEIEGLLPGRYFVFAEAGNAADDWAGGVAAPPAYGLELPPESPWTLGDAPVEVGLSALAPSCDFDLAPGQAPAWCQAVPVAENPEAEYWSERFVETRLPEGATVYLDMWPVAADEEGRFDLGEVAASHAVDVDGLALLPHIVTFRDPEYPDGRPSPDNQVRGVEGYMVKAKPVEVASECAVRIETVPGGAEVWVDRADEPLGTTPLDVYGLAAGSHALLLRKAGFLRPRPIEFVAEAEPLAIAVTLHEEGGDVAPIEIEVASGMPETPIYLDYLPTGLTTPATVGGMDPTEVAGWNWRSVSHSILLRRAGSRPYAARAVPDRAPVPQCNITGPNQFDDDDGDGIRNDREVAVGNDPSDGSNGGRGPLVVITNRLPGGVTRPIRVPVAWVAQRPGFHGRFQGLDDAEARLGLARDILEKEFAKNGRRVWECYVARLDPDDPDDELRVNFEWKDGRWAFSWSPDYRNDPDGPRVYAIESANRLEAVDGETAWKAEPDAGKAREATPGQKFFRVSVSLPDEP